MNTASNISFNQLEIDFILDQQRLARAEWQRAIDDDLRILRDYVSPDKYIVWKPGEGKPAGRKAQEVHLSTSNACTCPRHKLRGTCQHTAFVKRLEAADQLPGLETPVHATDVDGNEEVA